MNVYSFVGKATYCKKDTRYPPLCTKLEATSGNHFNKHLQKKEKREIQVQILKLDKMPGVLWEIT